jgi:hypothetical protein
MIELNLNPSRKDLRIFAALQVPFFSLVSFLLSRNGKIDPDTAWWIIGSSAAAGIVGFVLPAAIRWIYVVWTAAVFPIGWVMSYVLLGGVFYLVVTPIGLIMRICGRDPMQRKFDSQAKTYWQPRTKVKSTDRYFRQF